MPITHDDNGNLRQDANFIYDYDEENCLILVTRRVDNAVVGEYQYDALGRRVVKRANPAGILTDTHYFYDDTRIIEEQDEFGTTQATYVYGGIYIDEVLTMDRSGQTFYYHQNTLWSVAAVTNSAGTVVERYAYDAYGCVTISDGSGALVPVNSWGSPHSAIGNPYIFTGRQLDEETGLYYYRARFYDCVKGRFLQRDPLGYVDGVNLYEYVHGNPINLTDPTGETWKGSWCRAACWALGGALCATVGCLCTVGTVITVGGLAVPCTAVIIASCTVAGGAASLCSDLCPP